MHSNAKRQGEKGPNCGQIKNKRCGCTFTQSIMQLKSFSKSAFKGFSMLQSCVFSGIIEFAEASIELQNTALKSMTGNISKILA